MRLLDPAPVTSGGAPAPAVTTTPTTTGPVIANATVRPGAFAIVETELGHVAVKIEDFIAATTPIAKGDVVSIEAELKAVESKNPIAFGALCGAGAMALIALIIHLL